MLKYYIFNFASQKITLYSLSAFFELKILGFLYSNKLSIISYGKFTRFPKTSFLSIFFPIIDFGTIFNLTAIFLIGRSTFCLIEILAVETSPKNLELKCVLNHTIFFYLIKK